jgi:hypothetical protein
MPPFSMKSLILKIPKAIGLPLEDLHLGLEFLGDRIVAS